MTTEKTASIQRLFYYRTLENTRIYETPYLPPQPGEQIRIPSKGDYVLYSKILKHLGIEFHLNDTTVGPELVIRDKVGHKFSDKFIREYIFIGFAVRTALLARILHFELKGAASSRYGSLFGSRNMSSIGAFDYDTVVLPGFSDYDKNTIHDLQNKDIDRILGTPSLLTEFFHALGEPGRISSPHGFIPSIVTKNQHALWKAIYRADFNTALKRIAQDYEEIGVLLKEHLQSLGVIRPMSDTLDPAGNVATFL